MRPAKWGFAIICILLLAACSVSYKFNGASIDYTKTKTIQINDFPIRSTYVWGPMASIFNNELKDIYAKGVTRWVDCSNHGIGVDWDNNKKIYEDLNKVVIYFQSDHKKENRIKKF